MFMFSFVIFIGLVLCIIKIYFCNLKEKYMSLPAGTSNVGGTNLGNNNDLIKCPRCDRLCKGKHGLSVHTGKAHKTSVCVLSSQTSLSQTPLPQTSQPDNPFWQTLSKLKTTTPFVKRIPRGARITVAQNLSTRLNAVISENSQRSWEHLLLFSFQVLHAPNTKKSLTSTLKNNCQSILCPTIINTEANISQQSNTPKLCFMNHSFSQKVESKVSDGDLKGATQLLFSSDVIAPDSPETLSALIEKHPVASSPSIPQPTTDADPLQVTEKDVKHALMSFKNGSAGGLDGLTAQHLKDLVFGTTGDAGQALLKDITALINLMLLGKVHSDIAPILYGARLCALTKKDGGIRPIAVGCTFRRIASKVCCRHIYPKLTDILQPIQLGFGSKGGCEAAVHSLRNFINLDSGEVILKVDVKNAFNSVSRGSILNEIQNSIPETFHYLRQCYGLESKLVYGNHLIYSSTGCQQGDPLGPAIFGLAIHPIISTLNSKLNMWYLDDGTLGGSANTVLKDLETLIEQFKDIGLDLNFSKCELFMSDTLSVENKNEIMSKFSVLAPNIKTIDKKSLRLLGAPILEESFSAYIEDQQAKFESSTVRLLMLHSHVAFHIIKYCLFVPQLTYVLRCCPFWKHENLLVNLDTSIKNILSQILNCSISENSWTQASLPIRMGGIGIRKISSISLPAFLSSVHSVGPLYHKIVFPALGDEPILGLDDALSAWNVACPGESLPLDTRSQKLWDEPICRLSQQNLLSNCSDMSDRARLLATSERESGLWLQAIPSTNIGTLLDNSSFSIAIGLRLGISRTEPHNCRCGVEVDRLGHHGLSCRRSAGRISRHAALNDVLRRAFATVNVPACLEPNGISRDDGKRPDGLTLVPWSRGKPLVWDATCSDTLAPSHLLKTSKVAGAAADVAELNKRNKYASLGESYIFLPFAVETMGPWGPAAKSLIKEISKRLTDLTRDQKAGTYLGQRISLAIQRGNVASFLGTLPTDSDLDVVFYL